VASVLINRSTYIYISMELSHTNTFQLRDLADICDSAPASQNQSRMKLFKNKSLEPTD